MKLKLIEWQDSRGVSAQWQFISTVKDDNLCICNSVGWVIKESKECVTIAPHIGIEIDGDNQVCGEMHIPKRSILKMKTLRKS